MIAYTTKVIMYLSVSLAALIFAGRQLGLI